MSRFLKVIVNAILICAILVAGALLIPPFAGIPMVVVDEVDMDTNLSQGSVTYAKEVQPGDIAVGDSILINQEGGQYVYQVEEINGDLYTLKDTISSDGQTQELQLTARTEKVLITLPFIGYASMALKTTEGLIVVGLAVVFVIILFILAEIWKKDDEEDDEDEEEETEEEPVISKKEARKQKKAEKKARKSGKKGRKEEAEEEPEEEIRIAEPAGKTSAERRESEEPEKDLFAEMENAMASDIASFMEEDAVKTEPKENQVPEINIQEETGEKTWKPAMPVRTKEELLKKAHAEGDDPKVREDELSGVTLVDYSDIL